MERIKTNTGAVVTVVHGDGTTATQQNGEFLLYDPPWDVDISMDCKAFDSVLAFTDGKNLGRCFSQVGRGDVQWQFVWDCVSSWYTKNRPLKRHKSAIWFGADQRFVDCGVRKDGLTVTPAREVSNARGRYSRPEQNGSQISDRATCLCREDGLFDDIHTDPITKLHTTSQCSNHGKPIAWLQYMIGGIIKPGQSCVDPFGGTGAFAVACASIGVDCVTFEIDQKKHDEIVRGIRLMV